jgi:hypothetical protein
MLQRKHLQSSRMQRHIQHHNVNNAMKHNIGTIDRTLRIALGLALVAASLLGYIGPWGWIGLLPIATGIFRVCPAYWPFGLSTCTTRAGGRP